MDNELENLNETSALEPETMIADVITATVEPEVVAIDTKETNKPEIKKEIAKDVASPSSNKRILQGSVVSNKADKTIIIKVVRQVAHPIYKKYYKKTNKFMAHDEKNECNPGDVVRVRECRHLSARKCWELVEIVERAK